MDLISRPAANRYKPAEITKIYSAKLRLNFFKKSLVKFFTMRHCPSASSGISRFFGAGISVPWNIDLLNGANQNYLTLDFVGRAADGWNLCSTARTANDDD